MFSGTPLRKQYGSDDNFDIIINPDKGDMEIWRNRVVVADGEVEDSNSEISLSEARKIEPDFEVGEEVSEEVKLIQLGCRAILALRQNLISKIHEHDNTNLYKQFKDIIGDIYTAEVHHVRPKAVILVDDEVTKSCCLKKNRFRLTFSVREITCAVS
jgi:N utilization substance protein A